MSYLNLTDFSTGGSAFTDMTASTLRFSPIPEELLDVDCF